MCCIVSALFTLIRLRDNKVLISLWCMFISMLQWTRFGSLVMTTLYIYYFMYYVRNESLQAEICDNVTRNNNTNHYHCKQHIAIVDNVNSTNHNGFSIKYNTALFLFNTSKNVQNHSPQPDVSLLYIITNSTSGMVLQNKTINKHTKLHKKGQH